VRVHPIHMGATVQAYIDTTTETGVSAGKDIEILALDQSVIKAKTNAVAVSAALGFTGVAAAVGVSLAENVIENTVEAFVQMPLFHQLMAK
jgi:hypothetical protein